MPISTSGVSVPQVSSSFDPSIYQQNATKPMTIADMLDISQKQLNLQKSKDTYADQVAQIKAESQNAQQIAQQNALKTVKSHVSNIAQGTAELITDPDLTPEKILKKYKEINAAAPGDAASKAAALQQVVAGMPQKMPSETDDQFQTRLQTYVAGNHLKGLDHLAAVQQAYPGTANVSTGGQTVNVSTGNPLLTGQAPGTPTGAYLQNTLAPSVQTSATGEPMQFGGGGVPQAGNLNNRPVSVQGVPATGGGANISNMPQQTTAPQGGVTKEQMGQPKTLSGPIPHMVGESYDSYKERVGKVQQSVGQAKEDINVSNPNSVTNAKYTNQQILKTLDDKNIRVGPLMQAIADKTEGLNLTPDEQYVKKLLEQRIQQQQARSNADQTSKSIANGNFGNSKDTIRNVLFKDMGTLTAQELQARGTLSRAGDINKPNLSGVNQFQNDFAKNADPQVTHLIGVIGNKPLSALTKSEIGHLQKEFGGMSKEDFNALMKKRQALIDLAGK